MKKTLLILSFIFSSATLVLGQAGPDLGSGLTPSTSVQKYTLDFSAEVNGEYLIINFEVAPQSNYTIDLYDITGKRVATYTGEKGTSKRMEFSLNQSLAKGLYIVRITSGKQAAAKKFQIQ
jgi:methionine-rich copper-binding protein CopC